MQQLKSIFIHNLWNEILLDLKQCEVSLVIIFSSNWHKNNLLFSFFSKQTFWEIIDGWIILRLIYFMFSSLNVITIWIFILVAECEKTMEWYTFEFKTLIIACSRSACLICEQNICRKKAELSSFPISKLISFKIYVNNQANFVFRFASCAGQSRPVFGCEFCVCKYTKICGFLLKNG